MNPSGAESVRVAYPLFQAEGGGSTPTSALSLRFYPTTLDIARGLNRLWHSRLPRYTALRCRVAYVAEFAGLFYAVAIWRNPIARNLPQHEWMELSRMAVAPDAPKNTASRMLAWMAKDVARRFPDIVRLVSYQDCEVHTGTIYKAAGWTPTARTRGGEWAVPTRWAHKAQSAAQKQRWEKGLRRETAAVAE